MTAFMVLNQRRAQAGVPLLASDQELRTAAHARVAQLIAQGALRHAGGEYAEVLACGSLGDPQVIREWLGSPPHHAILLDPRYTRASIVSETDDQGRIWWVGLFR